MRTVTCTAIAAALILMAPACKQQETAASNEPAAATTEAAATDISVLNGTWKTDRDSVKFEGKPDEFVLKDGKFTCSTCIPPVDLVADGQFHEVTGRPYADHMSIKAVDDKSLEWKSQKGGRDTFAATFSVSADGNTLTRKFKDMTTPNAPPVEGASSSKRVGAAPAGAHAVSGQWMAEHVNEYSEDALNATYKVEGNKVSWSGMGQSYTAELGGPAVPVTGDIGGTTVQVSVEGNGLKEVFTRDGKVVSEAVTVPSADGQSVTWTSTDPRDGSKVSGTAKKTS
ncbi:hypothetical protein LZ016_07665 [Sphingomonas sp. SM33]|uniref:Lipoprotein n=1 Tax=Sphingomonas telluris TaxID=2907998 RepID=A0ABS9VLZ3_9SPHN|nr:hypothetical protein [Sphingomonas telluris]MCH8615975.1 hypothetical protein [Sphingomonas telluris]